MFGLHTLIQKILLLTIMMVLGYIFKKSNLANENTSKSFANVVIYLAQPAMIIYSFLDVQFSKQIILTSVCVFIFAIIFHFGYYAIALLLFRKNDEKQLTILRFSACFTNSGFLGIPLISELINPTAAVYATFYVAAFNIFSWSLGCYLFTKNRKYIQPKKMFINPATVPTYIGLALFLLINTVSLPDTVNGILTNYISPLIKDDILFLLKSSVIPLSMMMVGIRLAETKLSSLLKDKNIFPLFITRLILIPLAVMLIMKAVALLGIIPDNIIVPAATVTTICASTPVATIATVFAEKFDGDAVYSSKIISASTILSMITMPLIASLITFVF